MAQYRQSGMERMAVRNGGSDHISIGVRAVPPHKHSRFHRRFKGRRISAGVLVLMIALIFLISASTFLYLSRDKGSNDYSDADDDGLGNDQDFLANVSRTERSRVLEFGHGSVAHGGDSRYWERDDRRRDEDYSEDVGEHSRAGSISNVHTTSMRNNSENKVSAEKRKTLNHKVAGLYDEAGRNELKMYEAEYEASLRSAGQSRVQTNSMTQQLDDANKKGEDDEVDADDEYDDEIDMLNMEGEDYNVGKNSRHNSDDGKFNDLFGNRSFDPHGAGTKDSEADKELKEDSYNLSDKISLKSVISDKINADSRHVTVADGQSLRRSSPSRRATLKKKPKRRKFSGACEMKFLNSTTQIVEPLVNRKFARFSLQYTEGEEKPIGLESWEPRFAGHQDLQQREKSFIARDQRINCGFVKGPKGSQTAGFDLAEDDAKYISTCHIAVISCIFGNSDRLRSPMGKTVSRLSRKNVCFVMFVDEVSLKTLSSEGQMPDRTGFVGLWKVVMVKNLPYIDMRRVGKIPKLLPHRIFPSARYSIWLDSKLRLQLDPLLVLEYFLWRKGHEYAISNHYDRHCVWDEVAQNKKLNKYNHTIIDQQFAFYQADGLKRFNRTDPNKLLPSNVPEGSFIVREHTPMSNLFSCLWFNEVERFTPRDQLSFAYTYHKLRRMNPDKPFYLNMFKDCERRKIAKLYRHRSEERRYEHATE